MLAGSTSTESVSKPVQSARAKVVSYQDWDCELRQLGLPGPRFLKHGNRVSRTYLSVCGCMQASPCSCTDGKGSHPKMQDRWA